MEIPDFNPPSGSLGGLRHHLGEHIAMKSATAQHGDGHEAKNQKRHSKGQCDAKDMFTLAHVASISYCRISTEGSKGLTQGDEQLRGLESGNRIQVSAHINSYRADGSLVAQTHAHGVAVIAEEMAESNITIHVTTIIEQHPSQALVDRQGKAALGVNNEELAPAAGSRDLCR